MKTLYKVNPDEENRPSSHKRTHAFSATRDDAELIRKAALVYGLSFASYVRLTALKAARIDLGLTNTED